MATLQVKLHAPRNKVQVALDVLRQQRVVRRAADRRLSIRRPDVTTEALAGMLDLYRAKREQDQATLERMVFYAQTGLLRLRRRLLWHRHPRLWPVHCFRIVEGDRRVERVLRKRSDAVGKDVGIGSRRAPSTDPRSPVPPASELLACAIGSAPPDPSSGRAERLRSAWTSLPLSLESLGPSASTSVPRGRAGACSPPKMLLLVMDLLRR
ncbi:hypothetical protein QTI33_08575 [Variovorax sp. J22P271]|uniref:hypothetical protein n=1 Tax=Variovorax davisae TaxID=3053515 RepID=UPI002578F7CE|nr:hypothetical protein [Variovorax sp. J22P271]MDM0032188.1 hypothetical protein [Variovorax sp. J22P271]